MQRLGALAVGLTMQSVVWLRGYRDRREPHPHPLRRDRDPRDRRRLPAAAGRPPHQHRHRCWDLDRMRHRGCHHEPLVDRHAVGLHLAARQGRARPVQPRAPSRRPCREPKAPAPAVHHCRPAPPREGPRPEARPQPARASCRGPCPQRQGPRRASSVWPSLVALMQNTLAELHRFGTAAQPQECTQIS